MKYALIGCGRVAPCHIKAAQKNGLEIVALCDCDIEKAKKLAAENGVEKAAFYSDYKEMIKKERPEIVSIAAISGVHAEIAVFCAESGVNFIVEKPMAMSIDEADKIIAAVEKSGVTASVCHQNRFNTAVLELRRALDEGRFGKISHASLAVRWHRGDEYYLQDGWRGKWATDGGTLMNQCIHGMDLLRWLLGDEIDAVFGFTNLSFHTVPEAEDVGVAVVKFKNGATATVEGTVNAVCDMEETLAVFGEKGTVRLAGMAANEVDFWRFCDERHGDGELSELREEVKNVYGNGHTGLFADVISAVKERRAPFVDVYAGKRAVEFVLSVYKSQKTGLPVKLPLKNFGSADMAGEFKA